MKDEHPVNVKLARIFDLMDELNISMYFDPYRGYIVEDGGDGRHSCAITLPPTMETKLIREATAEERDSVETKRKAFSL